ncbi:MAG: hypothetical protein K2M69_06010 [Muribaculaceae bacterium]|nr:hypothetical protein [Muribaculaceae bacterium]
MELTLDKTKEGRILLRYEDGNYRKRWIDLGILLKLVSDDLDFDSMSDDIHNAVINYVDLLRYNKNEYIDYNTVFYDIGNLMVIAKHLKSLDAQDRNEHTGYVGDTTEIFRVKISQK